MIIPDINLVAILLIVIVLILQLFLFGILLSGILQLDNKLDYLIKKVAPVTPPKEKDPWA